MIGYLYKHLKLLEHISRNRYKCHKINVAKAVEVRKSILLFHLYRMTNIVNEWNELKYKKAKESSTTLILLLLRLSNKFNASLNFFPLVFIVLSLSAATLNLIYYKYLNA